MQIAYDVVSCPREINLVEWNGHVCCQREKTTVWCAKTNHNVSGHACCKHLYDRIWAMRMLCIPVELDSEKQRLIYFRRQFDDTFFNELILGVEYAKLHASCRRVQTRDEYTFQLTYHATQVIQLGPGISYASSHFVLEFVIERKRGHIGPNRLSVQIRCVTSVGQRLLRSASDFSHVAGLTSMEAVSLNFNRPMEVAAHNRFSNAS